MKCPSCSGALAIPEPRCPHCRTSLQKLDMKFGLLPRHSRYLSDRSGRLDLTDMEQIRESLRLFEKKFPQILFSVFVADLEPGGTVQEYAFWLANRARFSSIDKTKADNFNMLLVIDVATNAAALTTGYGLEAYVDESDLEDALIAGEKHWRDGDFAAGIQACIAFLVGRLRELSVGFRSGKLQPAEVVT